MPLYSVLRFSLLLLASTLACSAAPTFTPLSFGDAANTGFCDAQADDRQGGWTDQGGNDLHVLPPGKLVLSGVPFTILGEASAPDKTCIVLGGPNRSYLPVKAVIPVPATRGACLYLLHAAAWCPPAEARKITGVLTVDYADGTSDGFNVRFGRDVGDWTSPDSYPNAARAWTAYNANTQASLFLSRFPLKQKPVTALHLKAKESAWMVVAASLGDETPLVPLRAELSLNKKYTAPALDTPLADSTNAAAPKNIVLVIGDGMGPGALKLTSLYQHHAEGRLVLEQLPVASLCTTRSASTNVTDSAAAATAIACGYKTENGFLGLTPDKRRLTSLAEAARQEGRAVGLLTTDAITGATPAGFFAHADSRGSYSNVADWAASSAFDILIGNTNGLAWFLPKAPGGRGQRSDARDVLADMSAAGYVLSEDPAAFAQTPPDKRVLGFMAKDALDPETGLGQLTETALARLAQNDKGFFLMVEGSLPDGGGHGNKPELTVRGTLQVDWAVKRAVEFARLRGDTLVLVTADHETGGLNCSMSRADPRRLTIHYAATSHTGAAVNLYAYGPGANLFSGVIDNTDIAKTIARLWNLTLPEPVKSPLK